MISARALFSVAALTVALSGPAGAWGQKGHEVVAIIAEAQLSNFARSAVMDILRHGGKESMADVAIWADKIRQNKLLGLPAHTSRLPLDHSPYDGDPFCRQRRCSVAAFEYSERLLKNPRANIESKEIALKFVIHLAGDIHQPLHSNEDVGGWLVTLNGQQERLHNIWDRDIIESRKVDAKTMAAQIMGDRSAPMTPLSTPEQWAIESRDIARDWIYKGPLERPAGIRGARFPHDEDSGISLPDDYYQKNWPVVRDRLKHAGDRLAATLNAAFH